MTPRMHAFSDKDNSLLRAPRSLNEPVYCRFSNFTYTLAPSNRDKALENVVGVRTTASAMAACARCTSSMSSGGVTNGWYGGDAALNRGAVVHRVHLQRNR